MMMDMMDSSARLIRVMIKEWADFFFLFISLSFKDSMASVDYTFVYLFIIALMQLFIISNVYTLYETEAMLKRVHIFTLCGLFRCT